MASLPFIDWDQADKTASTLIVPGPRTNAMQVSEIVADLRTLAASTGPLIVETAQMEHLGDAVDKVVDRPTLMRANLATAKLVMTETLDTDTEDDDEDSSPLAKVRQGATKLGAGARGVALGTVLAVLASKILGQFDPFAPQPALMLSAPTIMEVERKLRLDPHDFRTWVTLHEQTHRVQFANAPWLKAELMRHVRVLVQAETQADPSWRHLKTMMDDFRKRRQVDPKYPAMLLSIAHSEEAVESFRVLSAIMSLLEGHADVMMDEAAPGVIDDVYLMRRKFDQRRQRGGISALVNKFLGLDVKLSQYTEGAAFCRHVIEHADLATLNLAFSEAACLPTMQEIRHPQEWLNRMGG